jgi:hypothetical protein
VEIKNFTTPHKAKPKTEIYAFDNYVMRRTIYGFHITDALL